MTLCVSPGRLEDTWPCAECPSSSYQRTVQFPNLLEGTMEVGQCTIGGQISRGWVIWPILRWLCSAYSGEKPCGTSLRLIACLYCESGVDLTNSRARANIPIPRLVGLFGRRGVDDSTRYSARWSLRPLPIVLALELFNRSIYLS